MVQQRHYGRLKKMNRGEDGTVASPAINRQFASQASAAAAPRTTQNAAAATANSAHDIDRTIIHNEAPTSLVGGATNHHQLLTDLVSSTDKVLEKIGFHKEIIEELQRENSELQTIAQHTNSLIQTLVEAESNAPKEPSPGRRQQQHYKHQQNQLAEYQRQLGIERQTNEKLQGELKASQDLVEQLLQQQLEDKKQRDLERQQLQQQLEEQRNALERENYLKQRQRQLEEEKQKEARERENKLKPHQQKQQKKKHLEKQRQQQEQERQQEEAERAAEQERKRRIQLEKQEAAAHQERRHTHQEHPAGEQNEGEHTLATGNTDLNEGRAPTITENKENRGADSSSSRRQNFSGTRRMVTNTPSSPVRRNMLSPLLSNGQLARYVNPKTMDRSDTKVSIIFALLMDPSSWERARTLLRYESDYSLKKAELNELMKESKKASSAREHEEKQEVAYETQLDKLAKEDRGLQGRWGVFDFVNEWFENDSEDDEKHGETAQQVAKSIRDERADQKKLKEKRANRGAKAARIKEIRKETERITKLKDEIPNRINFLKAEEEKFDGPIAAKRKELENLAAKISEVKGVELSPDEAFHIDSTRNSVGQTFLMVAALNNDLDSARLCFELGASPNAVCPNGYTAMLYAYYFKLESMVSLIARNEGTYPKKQVEVWNSVTTAVPLRKDHHLINWQTTQLIVDKAKIPPETIHDSAQQLEESADSRMAFLTKEEQEAREFVFFDASLLSSTNDSIRRVVLLDKGVYLWFGNSDAASKKAFLSFIDCLKPQKLRKWNDRPRVVCHRRSIVGIRQTYEVLCAYLFDSKKSRKHQQIVLFSPYVGSDVEGVNNVGVLVWAVTTDDKASLFKTLIESTEFLRNKIEYDERFPPHQREVLELGKDMHLLDLQSTSIYTSKIMELFIVDIDQGDLERLDSDAFSPRKRIAYYEQQLNRAIFETEEEAADNRAILSSERIGMSTSLAGGAGTGKTLLMVKKIVSVPPERKILVVSRLRLLISGIKTAVEAQKDGANITFMTYDELLSVLARSVEPPEGVEHHGFPMFSLVKFGEATTSGSDIASSVSFVDDFIRLFLGKKERKGMERHQIEPVTLWTAFRIIKSTARCAMTKKPLCRQEYLSLPKAFGLRADQREVVYDLYLRYEEYLPGGKFQKWDEADRVLYILRWGPSVFFDQDYLSWDERAYRRGEISLLEDDGDSPRSPFFYDLVFADEIQDFTELDLALLLRMTSGLRSLFVGGDPAQSVETGIRMRSGTINDTFHSSLPKHKKGMQVNKVLQQIFMKTNHRTHAQNLQIAQAIRKIMARSFGIPESRENALINGPIPEWLSLTTIQDLADEKVFVGGNIVFLAPDEELPQIKLKLHQLGIKNDIFGVREAKGLEFDSCALIGFFSYIEKLGSRREWENSLRWLSSSTSITTAQSAEKIGGRVLEKCDYSLSHPEVLDQAMLLYTAITRARNRLYIIETKQKCGLEDFAFRRFETLELIKRVNFINQGHVEMTPAEHKARGVLLVNQARALARSSAPTLAVKEKFQEAADRFRPDKGNDRVLLDQCEKHMGVVLLKRSLIQFVQKNFFDLERGTYALEGRFSDVLEFEDECSKFFGMCVGDSFLLDETAELRTLVEEVFADTPYAVRFEDFMRVVKKHEP